ncbi:MAG TPA: ABC transporter permease [Candidatus Acidoferrum sp.]|nr:ABC transporter permease [Candidatus Acidoferrum sp.]
MRYLARRLLHAIVLLLGASLLAFFFTALAPGSYVDEMRMNPQISADSIAALKAQYNLDKPVPTRYAMWLRSALHGNLGFSFAYDVPVGPLLLIRARNTLVLTITATLLAWVIALPLGIWSAERSGRWPDRVITWITGTLLVIPDIALALGFLELAVRSGWFPTGGMVSVGFNSMGLAEKLKDLGAHMVLPVSVLVLGAQPLLIRHVRAAMQEEFGKGYVRAAEAHGISKKRILWRYALPGAANPLISLFGFSLGALLSGSLLVEIVTSWPGLGPRLLEAILARDLYVVTGGILISTVCLVGGNFVADVMLYWADPRIRKNETAP